MIVEGLLLSYLMSAAELKMTTNLKEDTAGFTVI